MRRRPGQAAQALLYVSDDLHELRNLFPNRLHDLNRGNIINEHGYLYHVQDANDVQHVVMTRVEVKTCKRCGEIKAVSEFYLNTTTGKPQAVCKQCVKESIKHIKHIEPSEVKKCRICGAEKPIAEFHKQQTAPDWHSSDCKACRKKYVSEYIQRKRKQRIYEKSKYIIQNAKR